MTLRVKLKSESKQKACVNRKLDFIAPVWRKPRNCSYTRMPKNIESFKMEEVYAVRNYVLLILSFGGGQWSIYRLTHSKKIVTLVENFLIIFFS